MTTDHMHGMDADRLLSWILEDLGQGSALGIVRDLFFTPKKNDPFRMKRYGIELETPLGAAAGPHTQMAQNIIAAWLCGARYMELKTVQVLDKIAVTKPCIDMRDEGYNCEWSQELSLDGSYEEYLKAWVLIHVLHAHFGFAGSPGMIFNMSAGYSMEGILSPTVQRFLDRMQNCGDDVRAMQRKLAKVWPGAADIDIPASMSDSLTISCMHGCPPDEVERIALYFLQGRRLNTTLKMNPTLLGPERVRGILNESLGYTVNVPDIAFEHDISYDTALRILHSCRHAADELGLAFGVKLTNTLEALNSGRSLPEKEPMVYMSGRALYPVSIAVARRLQDDFEGRLDISFCAGVDALNVAETLACGLAPLTVCSDLLKPGGYGRLAQYVENLREAMHTAGAKSIAAFARKTAGLDDHTAAVLQNLAKTAPRASAPDSRYARSAMRHTDVKTSRPLPAFDCAAAPCMSRCPAGQHIPAYLERAAAGDFDGALAVITDTNPFPSVLGAMCNQACREKCMRIQYDDGLQIREVKGCAALAGQRDHRPAPPNGRRVAIVGAGPAGLSCAFFLALAGCAVDVYESAPRAGGRTLGPILDKGAKVAALVIQDVDAILAQGVHLHCGCRVGSDKLAQLTATADAVYLSPGVEEISVPDESVIFRATSTGKGGPPSSLVACVGEGRRASAAILARLGVLFASSRPHRRAGMNIADLRRRQAFRLQGMTRADAGSAEAVSREASRCLQCDSFCGICVSVCPNRANVLLSTQSRTWPIQRAQKCNGQIRVSTLGTGGIEQSAQIMNIGDFCNECGNCVAFCPSSGAPYRDKPRLHLSKASFDADDNGFWRKSAALYMGKHCGKAWSLRDDNETLVYEDENMLTVLDACSLEAREVTLKKDVDEVSLLPAVQAAVCCSLVSGNPALSSAMDA